MTRYISRLIAGLAAFFLEMAYADSAGPVFPAGTHVYVGTAYDYAGYIIQPEAGMTVQALSTSGNILAAAPIVKPGELGRNFVLSVPLTSVATDQSAAVGDDVVLVVKQGQDGEILYASTNSRQRISGANRASEVRFVVATDYDGDGVPDDYVKRYAPYMEAYGYDPAAYDPAADYDGDGQSNYKEYISGTNPFDETDFLRIRGFKLEDKANAALTFEYVGSRLYLMQSASRLDAGGDWKTEMKFMGSSDHDVDLTTLYFKPVTPARFYRILVTEPNKE